jgi:hypothetical protein
MSAVGNYIDHHEASTRCGFCDTPVTLVLCRSLIFLHHPVFDCANLWTGLRAYKRPQSIRPFCASALFMNATTPTSTPPTTGRHHGNPVVAFIIGLSIILLASVLNAAGLNLAKLDHVRTSVVPKASRRKDWARPLWLLGMLLYM